MKRIYWFSAISGMLFLAFFFFMRPGPTQHHGERASNNHAAPDQSDIHDPEQPLGTARLRKSKDGPQILAADSPDIAPILEKLKALERHRFTFCREVEREDKITNEFLLSKQSEEDSKIMQEWISKAKGYTRDPGGGVIPWQEKLRKDYIMAPEYETFIISISYDKKTQRGEYDILGVPKGELVMREGNAPAPSKMVHFVRPSAGFSYDSNWRFSELIKLDPIPAH